MQFAQVERAPDQLFDGGSPHDQPARSVNLHHGRESVDLRIWIVIGDRLDDGASVVVGLERDEHEVLGGIVHTALSAASSPSLATRPSKAASLWPSPVSPS